MQTLRYKDYEGTAELDMGSLTCRGKILFIDDLVTYQSDSPQTLQREFEAAVDDYLDTCVQLERDPKKPFKGQFNIRVGAERHKALAVAAMQANTSINDLVCQAIDSTFMGNKEYKVVRHVHEHRVTAASTSFEIPFSREVAPWRAELQSSH